MNFSKFLLKKEDGGGFDDNSSAIRARFDARGERRRQGRLSLAHLHRYRPRYDVRGSGRQNEKRDERRSVRRLVVECRHTATQL